MLHSECAPPRVEIWNPHHLCPRTRGRGTRSKNAAKRNLFLKSTQPGAQSAAIFGHELRNQFMKLNTLQDLFIHELKDLYSAETQLVKALPKMAMAATNEDLQAGFEEHLEQTKGHVERLEQIAGICSYNLAGQKCQAMEGLIKEGSELISEDAEDTVRDAGLIGAAQRVEHYEIAAYGTARALANCLGYSGAAELLGETLEEEKATDEKLTELAESAINVEAAEAS